MKKIMVLFATVAAMCSNIAQAADGYVESTGAQIINTGYFPKPTTRIEVDFETVAAGKNTRIFGCSGSLYVDYAASRDDKYTELWSFQDDNGNWGSTGISQTDMVGVRRTVIFDGPGNLFRLVRANGVVLSEARIATTRTKTASCPLMLFARADNAEGSTWTGVSKTKIYGVKIYEDDQLVYDFKPVLSGGEPGLKDGGTGKVLVGNSLLSYGGDIALDETPYIESTGSQMIDTGYFVTPKTRIEFDCAVVEKTKNARFFGVRDANSLFFSYYTENDDRTREGWCFKEGSGNWTLITPTQSTTDWCNRRRTIVLDGAQKVVQVLDRTGNPIVSNDITTTYTKNANISLALFGMKQSIGVTMLSKLRVFGVRLYEDGKLTRDYRPALKNGKAGLLETLHGVFLTHSNDFKYGGSVGEISVNDDAYLESHGRQIITTDIMLSPDSTVEVDFMTVHRTANSRIMGCRDGFVFWDYCNDKNTDARAEMWSCQDGSGGNYGSTDMNAKSMEGIRRKIIMDSFASNVRLAFPGIGSEQVVATMNTTRTKTSTRGLEIFSARASDTTTSVYPSTNRVYGVKVYKQGVLVSDLKPCIEYGKPGLKDELTGKFFGNQLLSEGDLNYGGDIARSNDAYVESNGSTVLDTGYLVKHNTRIEFDCEACEAVKNARFFGCRDANNFYFSYYTENDDRTREGWCFQEDSGNWTLASPVQTTSSLLSQRRLIVLDGVANKLTIDNRYLMTQPVSSSFTNAHTKDSDVSLALFGMKSGTSLGFASKIRIYRVKLYEGAELKHDLVPHEQDGLVGFYDIVEKNMIGKASGLKLGEGSTDLDGNGSSFLSVSPDCAVSYGKSVLLSAVACGKVDRYVWTKDGEVLGDVTTESCVASWERRKTPVVYTVCPIYTIDGRDVKGSTATINVTSNPAGSVIVLR